MSYMAQLLSFLFFVVWATVSTEGSVTCPKEFVYSAESDTCVQVFTGTLTWDEARAACERKGGDLVNILNSQMVALISGKLEKITDSAWIGYNDIQHNTWLWLDENVEREYTNWYDGYPVDSADENCAYIAANMSGLWMDMPCTDTAIQYICELTATYVNSVSCARGWVPSHASLTCIKLHTDVLPWTDARASCQAEGGELVIILNDEMNYFISGQFGSANKAWTGLNDLTDGQNFTWLNQETEAEFINWYSGGPDTGANKDCVYIDFSKDNGWINTACDTKMAYICEKPGTVSSVSCPLSWVASETSNTCIKLFEFELNWQDSRSECRKEGGDLVKVATPEMNQFILGQYTRTRTSFWYGLNDLVQEGTWVWLDETTEADYIDWLPGEPTNGEGDDCVVSSDSYGNLWLDTDCSYSKYYICELRFSVINNVSHSCPLGWVASDESETCVRLIRDDVMWDQARAACKREGGDLIKIINSDMNEFILDQYTGTMESFWIGLNDIDEEGTWVWLDEPEEAEYTYWLPGGIFTPEEDCANSYYAYENYWLDTYCEYGYNYICELAFSYNDKVSCPFGWLVSGESGTCLKLYVGEQTWDSARADCQKGGGDLVKVVDSDMNTLIREKYVVENKAWLGLNDLGDVGNWVWLDENTKAEYTEWYDGYPVTGNNQTCAAAANNLFGQWLDTHCSNQYPFICENPPVPDPSASAGAGLGVGAVVGIVLVCLCVVLIPLAYVGWKFYPGAWRRNFDTAPFVKKESASAGGVELNF